MSGSRLRGEGDAHSDLDMVVLVSRPQRRRWNLVVGGIEVELFINPAFQMRRYFEQDRQRGRGLMPHLCASGKAVFDPRPRGGVTGRSSQDIAGWPAHSLRLRALVLALSAADTIRDIADVKDIDADRACYLIGWFLPELINNHYRVSGRWLHKRKRVFNDLVAWDVEAAGLARDACHGTIESRFLGLRSLAEHVLKPLGGLMPLEWGTEWETLTP